jgi:hypothetical protein
VAPRTLTLKCDGRTRVRREGATAAIELLHEFQSDEQRQG